MFKKGSLTYSIINCRCPRCREGKLFLPREGVEFKFLYKMPERCQVCGQKLELEPGFYWGAMYVSYALASGVGLVGFAVLHFLFGIKAMTSLWVMVAVLLLAIPLMFKLSRSIWVHAFVKYDRNRKLPENQKK